MEEIKAMDSAIEEELSKEETDNNVNNLVRMDMLLPPNKIVAIPRVSPTHSIESIITPRYIKSCEIYDDVLAVSSDRYMITGNAYDEFLSSEWYKKRICSASGIRVYLAPYLDTSKFPGMNPANSYPSKMTDELIHEPFYSIGMVTRASGYDYISTGDVLIETFPKKLEKFGLTKEFLAENYYLMEELSILNKDISVLNEIDMESGETINAIHKMRILSYTLIPKHVIPDDSGEFEMRIKGIIS